MINRSLSQNIGNLPENKSKIIYPPLPKPLLPCTRGLTEKSASTRSTERRTEK